MLLVFVLVAALLVATARAHPMHSRHIGVLEDESLADSTAAPRFSFRLDIGDIDINFSNSADDASVTLRGVATHLNVRGQPQLPVVRQSILIPDAGAWGVRVTSQQFATLSLGGRAVRPALGPQSRQLAWPDVIESAHAILRDPDVYTSDHSDVDATNATSAAYEAALFPAALASLRRPFVMRDVRGAVLEVAAVQYAHAQRSIRVLLAAEIELVPADAEAAKWVDAHLQRRADVSAPLRQPQLDKPVDRDFLTLYDALFINFDAVQRRAQRVAGAHLVAPRLVAGGANASTILILFGDSFTAHAATLAARLQAQGFVVITQRCKDLIKDPNFPEPDIKAFTAKIYAQPGSFAHLLLLGNDAEMPAGWDADYSFSVSDMHYVKFGTDDDDYHVDAFVSRLFANTSAQGWQLLDKVFSYEDRARAQQWPYDEFGMGSAEGDPTDCQSVIALQAMIVNGSAIFKQENRLCDTTNVSVTAAQVTAAVEAGVSLIQYVGHGTGVSWYTSNFGNADASRLTNAVANPFIIDVACMNGEFRYNQDPFAGRWLLGNPDVNRTGAIGMYASAPPADWAAPVTMSQGVAMLIAAGKDVGQGALAYGGAMYALAQWPDDGGKKIAAGYILYGASYLPMRVGQ